MKINFFTLIILFIILSCGSKTNNLEFIEKTSGRYYFNADEIIEVHFKEKELFLKWRNTDLKPLKINDSTFYAKELNEKLIFITSENKIELTKKREHKNKEYVFLKLNGKEKTPSEYLENNNYDMALKGYLAIKEKDSLNPVIKQRNLNRIGYKLLANNEFEKAIHIFKINTQLYPKSSNTYDSLGDAFSKQKDTLNAIKAYKKALSINPENRSSKRQLKKLTPK